MIGQNNRGVTLPATQLNPRGEGKPNTLVKVAPCEFVAIEYFDDQGSRRQATLLKIGNNLSLPPNSEEWSRKQQSVPKWLANAVLSGLDTGSAAPPAQPPTKDSVDILSNEGSDFSDVSETAE